MSADTRQVRSIILDEGRVAWIMERETPEERLAAWDMLVAIAFPEDESEEFDINRINRGKSATAVERTMRDAYHIFKGIEVHKFQMDSNGISGIGERQNEEQKPKEEKKDEPKGEEQWGELGKRSRKVKLTAGDLEQIEEWNRRFPEAKALHDYLEHNYFMSNRNMVCSEDFCRYAHNLLTSQRWLSTKTGRPLAKIDLAIHYIALQYKRRCGEIMRAEEAERQKNLAAEFEAKSKQYEQQSPTEIATIERQRRLEAEEAWMKKMMAAQKR